MSKMKKTSGIDIPEPCHEAWDNMRLITTGRFCGNCSKTVVDFTLMPDKDIIEYLSRHHKVCGRLYDQQLSRLNQTLLTDKRGIVSWRKLIAALCIAGSVSVVSVQTKAATPTEQVSSKQKGSKIIASDSTIIIRGKVVDGATGLPIEKAVITTDGDERKTETDEKGEFVLKIKTKAQFVFATIPNSQRNVGYASIKRNKSSYELKVPAYNPNHVRMGEIRTKPGQKYDNTIKIRSAKEIGKLGGFDDDQKVRSDSTSKNNVH